jgi:OmpA-OmpF porin, OOP family
MNTMINSMRIFTLLAMLLTVSTTVMADNYPLTAADLSKIETLQRQVAKLKFDPSVSNPYALSKAQAWLKMALLEYQEADYSGIVQGATQQAELQLKQVYLAANLSEETPHPYGSEKLRQDLWDIVASLKQQTLKMCADNKSITKKIAELEVQLVWIGHEQWESGALHAAEYEKTAENMVDEIQLLLNTCAPKDVPVTVPETTITASINIEKHTLETDALFAFDRYGVDYLVADGKQKLDDLIVELNAWKSIDSITINGHTDKIGTENYNQTLSQKRAEQIKQYLATHGVTMQNVKALGFGERLPVVECDLQQVSKNLIACMQPNRRVELVIEGEK